MKSESRSGRLPPAVLRTPRRLRRPRSAETERIRGLLQRLQLIVPAAPKDRQLPQLQVIRHVIDYICQLQDQVVRHPRLAKPPPPAPTLTVSTPTQTTEGDVSDCDHDTGLAEPAHEEPVVEPGTEDCDAAP